MKCDLLRSLEEDHLLHGFQRPHGEGAIQTTAGEIAASHTEGHTGHLQRFKQQRGVYITSGRIQEGKEQLPLRVHMFLCIKCLFHMVTNLISMPTD